MQFVRGISNLKAYRQQPRSLTIGNFDGVHCGHQVIFQQVVDKAVELDLMPSVMFFEPQPKEVLLRNDPPARLTMLAEKVRLIAEQGIESVVCLNFNEALKVMPPKDFVQTILVDGLDVRHLVVGDDFHFGQQQRGDFAMLQELGEQFGFTVENTQTCMLDGERVSSTRVRAVLEQADLALAERLLGRPYSIYGRVMVGQQLGRQLGMPTANLSLKNKRPAVSGVFAVEVTGLEDIAGGVVQGVANVGTRPTVAGKTPLLETHLFDFAQDIYGRRIRVTFRHKLRDEVRFDGLESLKQQIALDAEQARAWFAKAKAS